MRATIYNTTSKQVIERLSKEQNKSVSYIINQLINTAISQLEETEQNEQTRNKLEQTK